jgi:hypothetical protein
MSRNIRLLIVFLCASLGVLVALGFANARALGGAGFYAGLDALVKRAMTVREAAHPDYQREALSAMATNPMVGSVVRLDDSMDAARIIKEPERTEAYAAFENVFAYEFDQAEQWTSLAHSAGDWRLRRATRQGPRYAMACWSRCWQTKVHARVTCATRSRSPSRRET